MSVVCVCVLCVSGIIETPLAEVFDHLLPKHSFCLHRDKRHIVIDRWMQCFDIKNRKRVNSEDISPYIVSLDTTCMHANPIRADAYFLGSSRHIIEYDCEQTISDKIRYITHFDQINGHPKDLIATSQLPQQLFIVFAYDKLVRVDVKSGCVTFLAGNGEIELEPGDGVSSNDSLYLVNSLCFHGKDETILFISTDYDIRRFDTTRGEMRIITRRADLRPNRIRSTSAGLLVVSCVKNQCLFVVDGQTGDVQRLHENSHNHVHGPDFTSIVNMEINATDQMAIFFLETNGFDIHTITLPPSLFHVSPSIK